MIREFSVKTKPSNNKARYSFVFCLSISFALIMLSTFIPVYKGIVSLVGVALLTLALMLYTKYIAPIYYYDVTFDNEGDAVFVVRQQTGKKHTTLCRIPLREIVKIERQTAEHMQVHKTPMGVIKYSYLPTLCPAVVYRLTTSGRYERAEILIESSDEFADLLGSYSSEARELYTNNDEY